MDGYFQSTLASTTLQSNAGKNTPTVTKVIVHFPPSNKEFSCNELNTTDGIYPMLHETFYETIAPQFATGTRSCVVSVKEKKDSSDEEGSVSQSSTSSNNNHPFGLSMTPVMPIPNARKHVRSRSSVSSSLGHSASSTGLTVVTTHQKVPSYVPFSPSFPQTPTSQGFGSLASQELEENNGHSVGSLSSLFKPTQQLSTSTGRNNTIFNNSISKPKNHLAKTKSTFVLRFLVNENLQKILSSKTAEDHYLFYNIGSSFIWVDAKSKSKDPLSRIVFSKSYPLCHDINESTRCDDHLDIIIGFSTGDIIWYDPLGCKYVRLNKGGCMVASAVTMIKWIPGSDELFIAAFKDGSVMIMAKERDDQSFAIPDPSSWMDSQFYTFRPHRGSKHNPVSYWKVSKEGLTDFSFSPNGTHMALTGADGQLRIIDYRNEKLTDIFSSYYGKLLCADWSPDGHYILTGGQDDLVTIWSFTDRKMVARCQGHRSWVTGVAFDPHRWDEQNYRFVSVGEDCHLIFWDFSLSALQKPKHSRGISPTCSSSNKWPSEPPVHSSFSSSNHSSEAPTVVVERKKSLKTHKLFRGFSSSSTDTLGNASNQSFGKNFRKKLASKNNNGFAPEDDIEEHPLPVLHPPIKKNYAAILQPTTVITAHADPCVSIQFTDELLVTTDRRGKTRIWGRP